MFTLSGNTGVQILDFLRQLNWTPYSSSYRRKYPYSITIFKITSCNVIANSSSTVSFESRMFELQNARKFAAW